MRSERAGRRRPVYPLHVKRILLFNTCSASDAAAAGPCPLQGRGSKISLVWTFSKGHSWEKDRRRPGEKKKKDKQDAPSGRNSSGKASAFPYFLVSSALSPPHRRPPIPNAHYPAAGVQEDVKSATDTGERDAGRPRRWSLCVRLITVRRTQTLRANADFRYIMYNCCRTRVRERILRLLYGSLFIMLSFFLFFFFFHVLCFVHFVHAFNRHTNQTRICDFCRTRTT